MGNVRIEYNMTLPTLHEAPIVHIGRELDTIYESTASALSNPWKKRVRVDTIQNELLVRKIETKWPKLEKKLYKRAQKSKNESDIKEHKDFKRSMRREVSAAKNCCLQKVSR